MPSAVGVLHAKFGLALSVDDEEVCGVGSN